MIQPVRVRTTLAPAARAALLVALLAGCSTFAPASTAGPSAPPSDAPATPTPTATPVATASASPSQPASPSASDGIDEPPSASLGDGSATIAGALRTYCWVETCLDAFELPPMASLPALSVGGTSELTLSLSAAAQFLNWHASYGTGPLSDLALLADGGTAYDPDTGQTVPPMLSQATVPVPPPGDWFMYIVIRALEGEAHYAWHVTVP